MSTGKTTSANDTLADRATIATNVVGAGPVGPEAESLTDIRRSLALSACFEIAELSKEVRRILNSHGDEGTREALTRGMLARIETLADAAYSSIDPGLDHRSDAQLMSAVYCTPLPNGEVA